VGKERESSTELAREIKAYIRRNYPVKKEMVDSYVQSLESFPHPITETIADRFRIATEVAAHGGIDAVGDHLPTILASIKRLEDKESESSVIRFERKLTLFEYVRLLAIAEVTTAKGILMKSGTRLALEHLRKACTLNHYYTRLVEERNF
jgi:hypothetical protein